MPRRPQFTNAQCKAFVEAANPHQWVLTADSLHEQAVQLYRRRTRGGQLVRRGRDAPPVAWDNTNRATFLLCALALENAIKAFLIYERPEWISDGYLHQEVCSHRLVALAELSSLIPYRKRDQWVLAGFEEGNDSWMRYPCGRRADDILPEKNLPEELWAGYERVMRGYGNKLVRLLGRGWTGPYGDFGTWEMLGEWLGGGSPIPTNYPTPQI